MPKYKYTCSECGKSFLVVQGINDEPVSTCYLRVDESSESDERCTGSVRRVPASVGFTLKGSGWFKDGY